MAKNKPNAPARKRIKSCFITAPRDADLTVVTSVLRERGIEPVIAADLSSRTGSLLLDVTSAITKADLVLAILPPSERENIIFELGLAYGLQKPLLVMAPHTIALPLNIEDFQYIRADPRNREALSFALDQTLAAKPHPGPRRTNINRTKPLGNKVGPLLAALQMHPNSERDLIELIARAIKESGASTVVEHGPTEKGFDLAVWADELGTWVGNPLLIEVKRYIPTSAVLDQVADARLHTNPSQWVLLLYEEGEVRQVPALLDRRPFVLVLSLEEFFNELRHKSFGEIIIRLRNQSYHGVR